MSHWFKKKGFLIIIIKCAFFFFFWTSSAICFFLNTGDIYLPHAPDLISKTWISILSSEVTHCIKDPEPQYRKNPSVWLNKQEFRRGGPQAGFRVHMSVIWGHCVSWPGLEAHDRWRGWKSRVAGSVHRPVNCFQLIASLRFTFITRIAACLSVFTAAMMEASGVAAAAAECFSFCVAENVHA